MKRNSKKTFEYLFTHCNKAVFNNTFQLLYPGGKEEIPVLQHTRSDGIFWRVQILYQELTGDVLQIELWVDIGIPKMIDIYHKIAAKDPDYFFFTAVMGNYLASIESAVATGTNQANYKRTLYTLSQPKHVEVTLKAIDKPLEVAKKWFDECSTIKAVDRLLNAEPALPSAYVLMGDDRAYMGLIAAKLNDNEQYEQLKNTYIQTLSKGTGKIKSEFAALLNMLDSNNF